MKMKFVPENLMERIALAANLAPLPLMETQMAFTQARIIMTAADAGIFEVLGKSGKTAAEVANDCKTNPAATQQLLNALAGIGYVDWNNGSYSLRKKYHKWLLKDSPSNLIGKLKFQLSEWNWLAKLEDYLRTGQPMDLHANINKEEWANYQEGMRDLSINTAQELAGKFKLPAHVSKMLDIGGSHGLYSTELCKKYPLLNSTILELPDAIERASAISAKEGMTDRVKYKAGNVLDDDLGESLYDVIMINNVVHHFSSEQNIKLAQKIARALKPGGVYAIGEFIRQSKPGEGGAVASLIGMYFSLTSSSGTWSQEEMNSWQIQAGLKPGKPISLITLPGWKVLTASK